MRPHLVDLEGYRLKSKLSGECMPELVKTSMHARSGNSYGVGIACRGLSTDLAKVQKQH